MNTTPKYGPSDGNILLLTDSRGFGLAKHLSNHLTASFTILPYSGASLSDSVNKSINRLRDTNWTQVYMLAGLCSITKKDAITKIVSLQYSDPHQAVSAFKLEMIHCCETIQANTSSTTTKCIVAPVTGMNLEQYNSRAANWRDPDQQSLLNETIMKINQQIIEFNTANQVFTPWTSRLTHKRNRNTIVHNYALLSSDGCHLSDRLRSHWADAISVAVSKNSWYQHL